MTLKVLSGEARGRILRTLPQDDLSIRPMLGRMKKSVFDIIKLKVPGCDFLDLFAGVGSVGIEALSRGAGKCVFAEMSDVSLKLIKYNVNMLGYNDKACIVKCNVITQFERLDGRYDIVFMGPPYVDKEKRPLSLTYPALKNIVEYGILKKDSVLIAQKHVKEPVGRVSGLRMLRVEKYGDTEVFFYKSESKK